MDKICFTPSIDPDLSLAIATRIRPDNLVVGINDNKKAALLNLKRWKTGQTLNIGFINGTDEQKAMIKQHASEWLKYANLKFNWVDDLNNSMVRVFFGGPGSSSYIGTDCLGIPKDQWTIHFGWLDPTVIKHEFGHVLGLIHSHLSKNFPYKWNEQQVIKDLSKPPNNWDLATIRLNVLDPVNEPDTETPWEPGNIMNYFAPASWTQEHVAIEPGSEIGPGEVAVLGMIYPFGIDPAPPAPPPATNMKTLAINQRVSGRLPDDYELTVEHAGIYWISYTPRSLQIFVDGRQCGSLVSLGVGKKIINLHGLGAYTLLVRGW